jgi:hypothetical protein
VRGWRAHFVDRMKPRHLQPAWSIDARVVNGNPSPLGELETARLDQRLAETEEAVVAAVVRELRRAAGESSGGGGAAAV